MNRKRLLDAARAMYQQANTTNSTVTAQTKKIRRSLRSFPLKSEHVQDAFVAPTPGKFHSLLCHKIRSAHHRVLLASLYVGPAAEPLATPKEHDLLQALQVAAANPDVQVDVLLDKNRALRPVPVTATGGSSGTTVATTTSSAQAVYQAIQSSPTLSTNNSNSNNNQLYLFSVLPPSLQRFLPNPYNEVAGVFHIKIYIVDDSLILSGANLSEEYFVDRHDRYLQISKGGGGLVDFYDDLVRVLCDHADVYDDAMNTSSSNTTPPRTPRTSRTELLEALNNVLTEDPDVSSNSTDNDDDVFIDEKEIVAVAVPTFQAPTSFFTESETSTTQRQFPLDTEVTANLLTAALEEDPTNTKVRLSSAYLNPTDAFLQVLSQLPAIEFLTAGKISHGFAPKKKAGNKGKDWIPSVFLTVSHQASQRFAAGIAKLWYYDRPGWSFHAKGLWLLTGGGGEQQQPESESQQSTNQNGISASTATSSSLAAAICGSGNYGARSETLDMESNCVLILSESDSSLKDSLQQEWVNMMAYANHTTPPPLSVEEVDDKPTTVSATQPAPLSWPLQVCLPIIRKFL